MQRKRHINFKGFLSTSGSILDLGQRIRKSKLHSIPTLSSSLSLQDGSDLMKNKLKSNVLYSIPCVCILALLLVVVISLFPSSSDEALAWVVGGGTCTESYANFSIDNSDVIQQVAPGEVGFISKSLSISYCYTSAYNMYITAPTELKSTDGSTTLSGVGNNVSPDDMPSNSWGYAYSQGTDAIDPATMKYNSFTGVAQSIASSTSSSSSNSLTLPGTLAIAAKFDDEAASGHYTTTINISMVSTPMAVSSYAITYNANGGTGAPASQTCTTQGVAGSSCTTTLSSTKPTRTNYTFLGWSTSSSASTASYSAGGNISISSNTTLYAVWTLTLTPGFTSITNMQQMTSSICNAAVVGAYKDLVDTRDNSTYRVVKFNDGKCWMTSNLKIVNKTITSSDSNVSTSYTIPTSNISSFNTTATTQAAYYDSGTNTGYYTWCAATAGTCSSATSSGANATSSICPKGWKLPTGGSGGEYQAFATAESIANSSAGSTKIQGSPYNFAYTGYVYSGSLIGTTSYGYWWSRTAGSSTSAYVLYIYSSAVLPSTNFPSHYSGYAVRCVAQ